MYDWRSDIGDAGIEAVKNYLTDQTEGFNTDEDRIHYVSWAASKDLKMPFLYEYFDNEEVHIS